MVAGCNHYSRSHRSFDDAAANVCFNQDCPICSNRSVLLAPLLMR